MDANGCLACSETRERDLVQKDKPQGCGNTQAALTITQTLSGGNVMATHIFSDDTIHVHVVSIGRKYLSMYYVDPVTGKTKRRSTKTSNRKEAERVAARWEHELNTEGTHINTRITWAEFRDRYDVEKLAAMAPKTADAADAVFNHLERIISPQYLRSLTEAVLSRFQAELRREGMKETTIAAHLGHLRAALNWAHQQKLIPRVPHINMPKQAKGRKFMRGRPITTEEFERMLMAMPRIRKRCGDAMDWERYLMGLWLSGLRLAESIEASWDDDAPFYVDLNGRYPRFRIYAEAQKGRRDQYLPMTPDFAQFLLQTPVDERQGKIFPLRNHWTGELLSEKSVGRIVTKIGKAANVIVDQATTKYASAHDLRRAFGTRWAARVKPATLKELMRHRHIETTMKYYVDQDADDVAAQLWATFGSTESVTHSILTNQFPGLAEQDTQKEIPAASFDATGT